jgi:tripartite-type tricarboxylate transporter receptor subunit TctC
VAAHAQSFPSKPLRIVVPFPAGGTTDIVARLVGQRMSVTLGQPVLIENRGGAGGTIGAAEVAKSAPDGYTLLMHNVTFPMASVAAAVANRATYNIDGDFAGVSIAVYVPLVITAHPSVPAKDLKELATLLQNDRSLRFDRAWLVHARDGRVAFARRGHPDDARALQGRRAAQAGADRGPPARRR